MKLYPHFYLATAIMLLASCTSSQERSQRQADTNQANQSHQVISVDENFKIVMGQTIYVPVYSYIYHDNGKNTFDLAVTLSIRNTDLTNSIVITSVRYYNSSGKLVRHYLERPIQLAVLASTYFAIDTNDTSGGLGANFIVEWVAQTEVSSPVIEAVMIGSSSQQGISFISPGKVIKSRTERK